ncbi:MAG: hypothetical protein WD737_12925 [Gemmatimonadota bacterium]
MRTIVREGLIAGFIGATSVALWFFVIDLIALYPFATPDTLGRALFGLLGQPAAGVANLLVVLGYTAFHYLAFALVGIAVAALVRRAEAEPTLLAGAFILFIVFEVAFHALLSMFGSIAVFGAMTWYNVAIGNLVAAATMGTYVWRAHPELKAELNFALSGRE